jgi:hypothetical protein
VPITVIRYSYANDSVRVDRPHGPVRSENLTGFGLSDGAPLVSKMSSRCLQRVSGYLERRHAVFWLVSLD